MFIDDYGNEFSTVKEVKDYARENFYDDADILSNALESYFTLETIVDWIVTQPAILKQFKEYFPQELKVLEKDYIEDYIDCCEREW